MRWSSSKQVEEYEPEQGEPPAKSLPIYAIRNKLCDKPAHLPCRFESGTDPSFLCEKVIEIREVEIVRARVWPN